MDSGSSGSMQSSSGGDEEYDSRSESMSAFFNSPPRFSSISCSRSQPQPLPPQSSLNQAFHRPSPLLESLSSYLDAFSQSTSPLTANSLLNLDMSWRCQKSDHAGTDVGGLIAASSSSSAPAIPAGDAAVAVRDPYGENVCESEPSHITDRLPEQPHLIRNTKKRSRASRRAPTTVLTTDTSNFRAMVQEFTGIPSPPFSSSSFSRSRLDLLSTGVTAAMAGLKETSSPPYILRPFATRFPQFLPCAGSSSLSSSSLLDVLCASKLSSLASAVSSANISSGVTSSTSINAYQFPSDLSLAKQQQSQNESLFSFHPLIHPTSSAEYTFPNLPGFCTKSQAHTAVASENQNLGMAMLDEFSLKHGNLNASISALPVMDQLATRSDSPSNWMEGIGQGEANHPHLSSLNGDYDDSRPRSNSNIDYPATSADFHDQGSENETTKADGVVDSWICSSD